MGIALWTAKVFMVSPITIAIRFINKVHQETNSKINVKTIDPLKWHYQETRGFGVTTLEAGSKLKQAWEEGREFRLVTMNGRPWNYAIGVCPSEDWNCFFQDPPSKSPVPIAELTTRIAVESLTKPQDWLAKKVADLLASVNVQGPCTATHVRHGDTVLNYGYGKSTVPLYTYLPLAQYLSSVKEKNIVLATDDQDVIDQAMQDQNHTYFYIDKPRFRGNQGGWESFNPSHDRVKEMVALLADWELVKKCSTFVGSHSAMSNVFSLTFPPDKKTSLETRGRP